MSRLVVVTGAASGIGAAVATMLRSRGDRVIGVDLKDAEVCADLATSAGRAAAVAAVLEQSRGVVDGLVTCAGLSVRNERLGSIASGFQRWIRS